MTSNWCVFSSTLVLLRWAGAFLTLSFFFFWRPPQNDLVRNYVLVVFVLSTTGQGQFPSDALRFWKSLRRARLPPGCLSSLNFTTFGLGDSSYSK